MATNGYSARMKTVYEEELRPRLKDELELSTVMQVPRLEKITLNMGVGEAKTDAKALDSAIEVPSSRPCGFLVRTTTARTTSPFFTAPCGVAVFTVPTMMSPTRA